MLLSLLKQFLQIFTWFVVVAPWEQAIRVRLGKRVCKLEAGVYLRIPFADRVFKQSVRRRLSIIRPQTLTTRDRHVVTCSGAIGYAISDLQRLYDTLEAPNDTIENEVAGVIARFISAQPLADCTSDRVEVYVRDNIDLSRYGLSGQEFYMTQFATAKTYRLVMGEMGSWSRDAGLNMAEAPTNQPA